MGEKAEWTAGLRFSLERGGEGLQLLRSIPSYQPGPVPAPGPRPPRPPLLAATNGPRQG